MVPIEITVKDKIASGDDTVIVCGNSDYQVHFTFDEEWLPYANKTARFITKTGYTDVLFTGETCEVPILVNTDDIRIGVYADNLHTTTPAYFRCKRSVKCDCGDELEPTPDKYDQLLGLLNDLDTALIENVGVAVAEYLEDNPLVETDPTVPQWAKETSKPAYTSDEVGAVDAEDEISNLELLQLWNA